MRSALHVARMSVVAGLFGIVAVFATVPAAVAAAPVGAVPATTNEIEWP
ncbi:hypothetical protein [Streptomyces sp. NPDC097619]